jgi:hypothetical protein
MLFQEAVNGSVLKVARNPQGEMVQFDGIEIYREDPPRYARYPYLFRKYKGDLGGNDWEPLPEDWMPLDN